LNIINICVYNLIDGYRTKHTILKCRNIYVYMYESQLYLMQITQDMHSADPHAGIICADDISNMKGEGGGRPWKSKTQREGNMLVLF
jgi:hypothetical protein